MRLPRLRDAPFSAPTDTFEIVGVVRDTLNAGLGEPVMPEIYLPFTIAGVSSQLVVRTNVDPAGVVRAIAGQVYAIDAGQPVTQVRTIDAILPDEELATPRFNVILLSIFAAAGFLMAIVGVYGVMSSAVAQERQEIGVRLALGANGATIRRMVLLRGSRLLGAGICLGGLGTLAARPLSRTAGVADRRVRSAGLRRRRGRAVPRRRGGVLPAGAPRDARRSDRRAQAGMTLARQRAGPGF